MRPEDQPEDSMYRASKTERVQTIVIGAGQAGLSVGYHLARRKLPFVILDANERVGDQWRNRWDSLRLFTPAHLDSIPGMAFPTDPYAFPTKDEMADYLEGYVRRFDLPVRSGMRVNRLAKQGDGFVVTCGDQRFEAEQVVVAMSTFQQPKIPAFAKELDPSIVQLHSSEYRNPAQLKPGRVLIIGAGNSGAEIAADLTRAGRPVVLAGRDTGQVPFQLGGFLGRLFLTRFVLRVVFHRVLTLGTPMGRKAKPKFVSVGGPLIRIKAADLAALGVERASRVTSVDHGQPVLDGGERVSVENVIWCTGFHPGFSWMDLPAAFGSDGEPVQTRGVSTSVPGLYFVGLHFLYALSSTMIHGVGRDADHVAGVIKGRVKSRVRDIVPELTHARSA
jgi:putative flavoprotein involved in K+ transport